MRHHKGPGRALRLSQRQKLDCEFSHGVAVEAEAAREGVVTAARAWVGKPFADDCSGLVRAVFKTRSVDVLDDGERGDNGVTAIYRFALARGRVFTGGHPLPGVLAQVGFLQREQVVVWILVLQRPDHFDGFRVPSFPAQEKRDYGASFNGGDYAPFPGVGPELKELFTWL